MGKIITVNFRGAELYGFEKDDGTFVALKPIVEAMGLDWTAQLKRIKRDTILSAGMAMMAIPFGRGGAQDTTCLRLDLVNGWLFTIDSGRIKDAAVRERVLVYQRECYGVLFTHFAKGAPAAAPPISGDVDAARPETARVRMVSECRKTFGTRASAELWKRLGLPLVPAMLERSAQLDLVDYARVKPADTAR